MEAEDKRNTKLSDEISESYQYTAKSDIAGDCCRVFSVFFAFFVRLILFSFANLTVWLVVNQREDEQYWALSVISLTIVIEGIYTICTRGGQERTWICWCFVFYLISTIPCIWLLELHRLGEGTTTNVKVKGEDLDPDLLITVAEQCLIFLLILCRWLLPRGNITRDQLSQLLFVFIGLASDVMEMFVLFTESEIKSDRLLTRIILVLWTISMFQFSLVLTMSKNPKKTRVNLEMGEKERENLKGLNTCQLFMATEIWSLIVSITVQDAPFLAIRLYVIIDRHLINYSIIFFTSKNVLVILLLLYRFVVVCLEKQDNEEEEALTVIKGESVFSTNDSSFHEFNQKRKSSNRVTPLPNNSPLPTPRKLAADGKWESFQGRDPIFAMDGGNKKGAKRRNVW